MNPINAIKTLMKIFKKFTYLDYASGDFNLCQMCNYENCTRQYTDELRCRFGLNFEAAEKIIEEMMKNGM
ncbi:hypothetical protein LJC10_00635 [Selenomonadales bacterium OttesenSCG-928-I06]|nr:hypothetical protein [Selenomonadales bacterium OttesenSCG-928-I06]